MCSIYDPFRCDSGTNGGAKTWIKNNQPFTFEGDHNVCDTGTCPAFKKYEDHIDISDEACDQNLRLICQQKCPGNNECKWFLTNYLSSNVFKLGILYFFFLKRVSLSKIIENRNGT